MTHYTLRLRQGAPGDTIACTPLVRDLALLRPDIRVSVIGSFAEELFRDDPRVAPDDPVNAIPIIVDYKPAVDASRTDRTRRYLEAAHTCYRIQTGDDLPLAELRPSLVLTPDLPAGLPAKPYAVVAAGSKGDIPLKQHPPKLFADVVKLTPEYNWIQVGRTAVPGGRMSHLQPLIPNAANWIDRTNLRELASVVAGAAVVLCHTSLPMLLAQAFRVPCVVLGGGREDPWFHDAPGVTYLHSIGKLGCCIAAGCRASFPRQAHTAAPYPPGVVCADPVPTQGIWVGRCTTLVTAPTVAEAVRTAATNRLALPIMD